MKQATKRTGKERKIATATQLKEKLEKAKAFFLTDYRGMTHPQLESLRRALKKVKAEFVVAKNTLMRIAMKQCSNETMLQLEKELNNPTATFFAFGDEMEAIKAFASFIKNIQLPKVKIGIMGGQLATAADFQKLASLPSRDVLIATLALRLKSPIYGLHFALSWNLRKLVTALNNIKNKKG